VGNNPQAAVVTPDGRTLYVTNSADGTVTPIDVATGKAGEVIQVGTGPEGLAVTPDGRTLYVADSQDNSVTPVKLG
jgi:hyaluronoglucosaminidase